MAGSFFDTHDLNVLFLCLQDVWGTIFSGQDMHSLWHYSWSLYEELKFRTREHIRARQAIETREASCLYESHNTGTLALLQLFAFSLARLSVLERESTGPLVRPCPLANVAASTEHETPQAKCCEKSGPRGAN